MKRKNRFDKFEDEETTPPETQKPLSQPKVKRDTFTFPETDHQLIETLRQQCLRAAVEATKSEIIRAGLHVLKNLDETQLLEVVKGIEKIKTGKPKKQSNS